MVEVKKPYRKNVFRRVRDLYQMKLEELDSVYSLEEKQKVENVLELLKEVEHFLFTASYLKESLRERIQAYYKLSFDTNKVREKLGLTKHGFDKFIGRTSRDLTERFGESFFDNIEGNSYNKALMDFKTISSGFRTTGVMSLDFLNRMPEASYTVGKRLSECTFELQLFRLYALNTMNLNVSKSVEENLAYIMHILMSGETAVSYESKLLMSYLRGDLKGEDGVTDISFDGFIAMLKEREI